MDFIEIGTAGTAKPVEISIPTHIAPWASGDYVVDEVRHNYPSVVVPTTTASTVVFAAKEAAKEGLRLKSVKIGVNLGLLSLNLEWEKIQTKE